MPKPMEANPAEVEVLQAADEYVVKVGRHNSLPFDSLDAAKSEALTMCQTHNRGAAIYARATLHGTRVGALHSTYKPGVGWQLNAY